MLFSRNPVSLKSWSPYYPPVYLGHQQIATMTEAQIHIPFSVSSPDLSKMFLAPSDQAALIPDLSESSVSDDSDDYPVDILTTDPIAQRRKLQWKFKGLTIWLELEEFDNDLSKAVSDFSAKHNSPYIPQPHTTAIYGMEHLTVEEAKAKLQSVRKLIPQWPTFARPTGVTQDIAEDGKPGQVCSIAWSELTLASNPEHEAVLDNLYELFYGKDFSRDRPWKPHNSIAYDNPEDNTLSLLDTVLYAAQNPTLLHKERRVEAISLWSTWGKMEEWECLDRVRFW